MGGIRRRSVDIQSSHDPDPSAIARFPAVVCSADWHLVDVVTFHLVLGRSEKTWLLTGSLAAIVQNSEDLRTGVSRDLLGWRYGPTFICVEDVAEKARAR